MNAEQRAVLLRKRFRRLYVNAKGTLQVQIGLGMHRTRHPRELDRRELRWRRLPSELPPKIYLPWPQIIPETVRIPVWMRKPVAEPEPLLEVELPNGMKMMADLAEKWLEAMRLKPLPKQNWESERSKARPTKQLLTRQP